LKGGQYGECPRVEFYHLTFRTIVDRLLNVFTGINSRADLSPARNSVRP